ncbi:hypothetical protein O3M35_006872 [Rhynocoris fuscipes]|uniref:Uncharacterized protein n=1 Tax=Rhynocoris fuscipes TaxID=488301 RepID=A0AAW1DFB2_9HEMI
MVTQKKKNMLSTPMMKPIYRRHQGHQIRLSIPIQCMVWKIFQCRGKYRKLEGRRLSMTQSKISIHEKGDLLEPDSKWWSKESNNVRNETCDKLLRRLQSEDPSACTKISEKEEPKKLKKPWYIKVVKFFDLDLLKDGVYRNIWLGMSLAFTGEINFSLMTPLILGDRNFNIEETATFMSVIASADIIFRFLSPFAGEKLKVPPRYMYMYSLIMLVITRSALTFVYSYRSVFAVCLALGVAKGFRTVYMTLVIPNHVALEKLPSASGLQTVLNGILLLAFGPVVGFVRDISGDYNLCIYMINCMSLSTIILWSVEYLVRRGKVKKPEENIEAN